MTVHPTEMVNKNVEMNENGSGQIITTGYRRLVTLNGGLVGESSQNSLNSGLGIILICPDGSFRKDVSAERCLI